MNYYFPSMKKYENRSSKSVRSVFLLATRFHLGLLDLPPTVTAHERKGATGGAFENLIHCFDQIWIGLSLTENQPDRGNAERGFFLLKGGFFFVTVGSASGEMNENAGNFCYICEARRYLKVTVNPLLMRNTRK